MATIEGVAFNQGTKELRVLQLGSFGQFQRYKFIVHKFCGFSLLIVHPYIRMLWMLWQSVGLIKVSLHVLERLLSLSMCTIILIGPLDKCMSYQGIQDIESCSGDSAGPVAFVF